MESQKKCQYPDGWNIKIGPFSMDPCRYQVIEEYPASVSILKCRKGLSNWSHKRITGIAIIFHRK